MKLYNTLTRTRDEFVTHEPGKCKMYTCGPTVYHFAHIGNLRSYIMEDVLEKYLSYTGLEVTRCMNITDVGHLSSDADTGEDKMLKGAKREKKTVMEIAKFYTDAFFADCGKLNIKIPELVVPATSYIPQFIEMVEKLLEKGYAYVADGNVYFDTSKLDEYYVFNKHDAEDLEVGVRDGVEEDLAKRNKTDFVLWFTKSKFEDQELKWDSPWGVGYPGWHIECSAISLKNLGEYLDIHCGGIDNAFPHHTNEIAQSEAYLGHPWCTHWFHVLHLNTQSGKMSKSTGEFLTVSLLEEKGYNPLVYRLFCLQSHYRKSLVFSWEGMDGTKTAYNKLIAKIAGLNPDASDAVDEAVFASLKQKFTDAMDNDLNTALAVTALYDVLKAKTNDATKIALLKDFDTVLSLNLLEEAAKVREANRKAAEAAKNAPAAALVITCGTEGVADDMKAKVEELINARADAKKAKDFAKADAIRDELSAMGVAIVDVKGGVNWTLA
ncbi:MAG: cysteine--tRNA ligase [Clostridia bacterium]|nr:cysteine--tRNA ligase [Clostridia bacterium]